MVKPPSSIMFPGGNSKSQSGLDHFCYVDINKLCLFPHIYIYIYIFLVIDFPRNKCHPIISPFRFLAKSPRFRHFPHNFPYSTGQKLGGSPVVRSISPRQLVSLASALGPPDIVQDFSTQLETSVQVGLRVLGPPVNEFA